MSPFQILSVIVSCAAVFAGIVAFLSSQGVPLLLAALSVYLFAVACMLGMQRRAREISENTEHGSNRRHGDPSGFGAAGEGARESERMRVYVATTLQESLSRSGT